MRGWCESAETLAAFKLAWTREGRCATTLVCPPHPWGRTAWTTPHPKPGDRLLADFDQQGLYKHLPEENGRVGNETINKGEASSLVRGRRTSMTRCSGTNKVRIRERWMRVFHKLLNTKSLKLDHQSPSSTHCHLDRFNCCHLETDHP